MGKSLRSKRKMRLRTLKRELAEPHFEKKEVQKMAILEAAAEAPKVTVKSSPSAMEFEEPAAAMDQTMSESLKVNKKVMKRKSSGKIKKDKKRKRFKRKL